MRNFSFAFVLALTFICDTNAHDGVNVSNHAGKTQTDPVDARVVDQCGVFIKVPRLNNIFGQQIGFGCTGSYKNEKHAIMDMDFQYDPNNNAGGEHVALVVDGGGIEEKIDSGQGIFERDKSKPRSIMWKHVASEEDNCSYGSAVTVTPIYGENWHGWIAEESFVRRRRNCQYVKERTRNYRCVHVMIGNEKMTAQITGVCLLRKREYSLERGFSYDFFMEMIESVRFLG